MLFKLSDKPRFHFSAKYDEKHAKHYYDKHEKEFWRRISNWRDHQVARKALDIASNPKTILDVPCGTGRFWDVLTEDPERIVYASDYSRDMIQVGLTNRPAAIVNRIDSFVGSAFNLPVKENFVDCVFCIRFIHHIGNEDDRLRLLSEFRRITSDSIIISLWVDGNYQAWRRKRHEEKRERKILQNRNLIPIEKIEHDIEISGLKIQARLDFFKFYSMWRTYILRKV